MRVLIKVMCIQSLCAMASRGIIVAAGLNSPGFSYNETLIWDSPFKIVDCFCYTSRINIFASIGGIVCERAFATIYLNKYEKTKNYYLVFSFIFFNALMSVIVAYLIVYRSVNIIILVGLAGIGNVNGFLCFIFIYKLNTRRYRRALWDKRYTLSQRFQLSENIKTSMLMKRVYFFAFFSNFIAFGAYSVAYFMEDDFSKQLAKALFDFTILFYAYTLPVIAIVTIRPWRVKFVSWIKSFPINFKKEKIASGIPGKRKKPDLSHLRNDYGQKIVCNNIEEADIYFQQLQNSWK